MLLIAGKNNNYHDKIKISELDPENEIYLRWGTIYEAWHDKNFPGRRYRMRIGTGTMFGDFLDEPQYWGIAPASLARRLKDIHGLSVYEITKAPPNRVCYMEENKYIRESRKKAVAIFKSELSKYLMASKSIEALSACNLMNNFFQ